MTRRWFNASERAALYLAADGRCTACGRESAARTLRKHMSPDDLRALARLLLEEEDA